MIDIETCFNTYKLLKFDFFKTFDLVKIARTLLITVKLYNNGVLQFDVPLEDLLGS